MNWNEVDGGRVWPWFWVMLGVLATVCLLTILLSGCAGLIEGIREAQPFVGEIVQEVVDNPPPVSGDSSHGWEDWVPWALGILGAFGAGSAAGDRYGQRHEAARQRNLRGQP